MALTAMKYFGTSTTEKGHYIFDVYTEMLDWKGIDFKGLPFNPEDLVASCTPFGTVNYIHIEDYTIIAISGSCIDTRGGTKSVFWVDRIIDFPVLKGWILRTPSTKAIIDKMPFEVKW